MAQRSNGRARLVATYRGLSSRALNAAATAAPNAAVLAARKAADAIAHDPLRYTFGEPPPGRSALDKMRAQGRRL